MKNWHRARKSCARSCQSYHAVTAPVGLGTTLCSHHELCDKVGQLHNHREGALWASGPSQVVHSHADTYTHNAAHPFKHVYVLIKIPI